MQFGCSSVLSSIWSMLKGRSVEFFLSVSRISCTVNGKGVSDGFLSNERLIGVSLVPALLFNSIAGHFSLWPLFWLDYSELYGRV